MTTLGVPAGCGAHRQRVARMERQDRGQAVKVSRRRVKAGPLRQSRVVLAA